MKNIILSAAIIGSLMPQANAVSYPLWPWQYHSHRYHHKKGLPLPPNCEEINAVVKRLPPERYERALKKTTPEEQKIIADCAVQP